MVQQYDFTPRESSASMIGKSLATGLAKNFERPEQRVQRDLLSGAMEKMKGSGSYEEKLSAILPTLSTTPGGSEILSTLIPLMKQQASADAYIKYHSGKSVKPVVGEYKQENEGQPVQGEQPRQPGQPGQTPTAESQTTYPLQSTEPQPRRVRTPEEKEQRRVDISQEYAAVGHPLDPSKIEEQLAREDQDIRNYNTTLQQEKGIRAEAWDKMADQAMKRFTNSQVQKSPEDETVFKKFVDDSRLLDNPNSIYEAARDKYREFENARNSITNELDLANPIAKAWRKMTSTYKSKEDTIKSLQPPIKVFKKLGLVPEARNLLSVSLGFGTDDVERTIFPPTKQVTDSLNRFKVNPNQGFEPFMPTKTPPLFPGEESALPDNKFESFKKDIEKIMKDNPDINLINMRSQLNQQKRYGWQDINRAVAELIDEGRFSPGRIQDQQLPIIKQAPLPGMLEMFKGTLTGKR